MKIISWNVNGLRAVLRKGFLDFVKNENPDIICLQETKAHPEQVDLSLEEYPHHYWNSAEKKGYSGVAIFSKIKPLTVNYGIGILDEEGRVISLEFDNYYLITVYTPNSKRDLSRLDFRHYEWDQEFLEYIKNLPKPVIFCGDLNVAHTEMDIKNPDSNKTTKTRPGNAGFTDKERESFDKILDAGFIDSFRHLNPEEKKYSWWSYMFKARERNIGCRIDYFCINDSLKHKIKKADILTEVTGSDHAPILLELK